MALPSSTGPHTPQMVLLAAGVLSALVLWLLQTRRTV